MRAKLEPEEIPLPTTVYITPSKINPWREVRPPEGQRFTGPQLYRLKERGVDPQTVEVVRVRSPSTIREIHVPYSGWGPRRPQPVFVFDCPIIGRKSKDKLKVISPAGMVRWVYEDGSITRGGFDCK